ncbi:MAG: hypothetical protein HQ582_11280 [Planctomycetes bacterium]|nr:hypothetical protein [Planctomycetota bacterium]
MPSSLPTDSSTDWAELAEPGGRVRESASQGRLAAQGPFVSAHGTSGTRLAGRDLRRIAIWQLSGPMEPAVTEGVKDDVPSAEAAPIWYFNSGGSGPENEYQDAGDYTRSMRVYHVGAFPGDQRVQLAALQSGEPGQLGIPRYGSGDRVYAEFNQQSGRWEIIGPAEDVWRFELKTALAPSGNPDVPSTADAYLVIYDADQARYVRTDVEFTVADFLDLEYADPGCRGYAKRMADSHQSVGWEVLVLSASPSSSSSSGP